MEYFESNVDVIRSQVKANKTYNADLYGSANDPRIGPQMIPFWTANDPEKKVRNGMEDGMVWIEN